MKEIVLTLVLTFRCMLNTCFCNVILGPPIAGVVTNCTCPLNYSPPPDLKRYFLCGKEIQELTKDKNCISEHVFKCEKPGEKALYANNRYNCEKGTTCDMNYSMVNGCKDKRTNKKCCDTYTVLRSCELSDRDISDRGVDVTFTMLKGRTFEKIRKDADRVCKMRAN